MWYRELIKPAFDRTTALVLLTMTLPFLGVLAVLIYLMDGSPVLFVQSRTGKNMKPFNLLKFRTLKPSKDEDLSLAHRTMTTWGPFLRKTGIDELPQLFNILKGDMSFVGPRPLPVAYDKAYTDEQKSRFLVKPGITGWAQVNGRNNIHGKNDSAMTAGTWKILDIR